MAKVALLIGVSEYEVGLNPLPAAVKDVVALERILKDSEMGDFDEVKILTNPEPQAMQYEVETLFSGRSKDDFVLLFFSGHGIKDDSNNLYFATRITKKSAKGDLIRSTAVPARFVHEVMNNSRAKRQAIILDCCFSGAFDPSLQSKDDGSVDLQGQLGAEGRVVLTSSSSTQYSFEQQGSDLSLYTRYLIEGIETGAGDRDEDGKISARELHEYATSKVQETAPSMTPKLITLKDMGFDLVLAKAKVTDPKFRYRRQAERYSSRGAISSIGRTILDRLQNQLELSSQIAEEIETEVLRPYQERLENIQRYQQAFEEAVNNEYPLSNYVQSELEDLLGILGLRREDVDSVEQEIITGSQTALAESQQDIERQRLEDLEQQRQRDTEREKLDAEAKLQSVREAEEQRQERQNVQSRIGRPNSLKLPKLPFRLSRRNFMLVAGFSGVSVVALAAIRGNQTPTSEPKIEPIQGNQTLSSEPKQTSTSELKPFTVENGKPFKIEFQNGVNLDVVYIPRGKFIMGSLPEENGYENERPQIKDVNVSAFYMGKYQVTQAQWKAIMGNNPKFQDDLQNPVEQVSWDDVQDFCKKLSQKTGREFRLPSEAEWEYACRAGTSTRYYFGDDEKKLGEYAWFGNNSGKQSLDTNFILTDVKHDTTKYFEELNKNECKIHPVGQKKPNSWGLYDMYGNVSEWCQDSYEKYGGESDLIRKPGKAITKETSDRSCMLRGGSWSNTALNCRSASRISRPARIHTFSFGFRVVCVVR